MRSHLDEFARLLHTLTLASHGNQSDFVCGLADRLDQAQGVLAELFHQLSQPTTDALSAEGILEGLSTCCGCGADFRQVSLNYNDFSDHTVTQNPIPWSF